MYIHSLAARLKPGITDAQIAETGNILRGLQQEIPGLLAVYAGMNISPHAGGYGFGAGMHFADRTSLEAYYDHPAHQAVIPKLLAVVEDVVEVDYEA